MIVHHDRIELAGGGDFYEQQVALPSCPECETCKSNTQAHFEYLRVKKDTGFVERLDTIATTANILMGTTQVLFWTLVIGAIFHTQIIKFAQDKIAKFK